MSTATIVPESIALQKLDTARQMLTSGVQLSQTGLVIRSDFPLSDWKSLGNQLRFIEGSVQWWIGDWLNYGERTYGEKYKEALAATGYDYGYLRNLKTVAASIEPSRRRDNLTWAHHQEVAALPPGEQDRLLTWAGQRDRDGKVVPVKMLRAQVRYHRDAKQQKPEGNESSIDKLRNWIKEECPYAPAPLIQWSQYNVQMRSRTPGPGVLDVELRGVSEEELKAATLAIQQIRERSLGSHENAVAHETAGTFFCTEHKDWHYGKPTDQKPTAAVQNVESAEATQDSAPKKSKSEDEIITPEGHRMDVAKSSMQKAVRAGDQDAAVYWATEIALAGRYSIAKRRLLVTSVEDIGLADPDAIVQGWELLKGAKVSDDTSRNRALIQAARRLASAPKKRITNHATCWAYKTKHAIKAPATEKEVSDNVFTFRAAVNEKNERHALVLGSVLDKASSSGLVWDFLLDFARHHSPVLFKRVQVLHDVWRKFGARPDQPNAMKWLSEARLCYVQAIMLCCRATEDLTLTSVPDLPVVSDAEVQRIYTERTRLEPPDHAIDMHTLQGKQMGRDIVHFLLYGAVLANETDMPDPYKDEAHQLWLGKKADRYYAALQANAAPITSIDEKHINATRRSRVPEPPLPYGTVYKTRKTSVTRTGKKPGHWYVCRIEGAEGPKGWREYIIEHYQNESDADAHVQRLMARQALARLQHQRRKALAAASMASRFA